MNNLVGRVPSGYTLHHLQETDSTNAEALRRVDDDDSAGAWVVADRQSGGRGRSGRSWESEPGNLFASLLYRPDCSLETATQLSFVAALAAADCIASQFDDVSGPGLVRVKWPNDILISGKKIGGILLESVSRAGKGGLCVVLGTGLNVVCHPIISGLEATDLSTLGVSADRWDVFSALADATDRWIKVWALGAGFESVRLAWLERAYGMDEPILVRLGSGEERGVFRGIDERGALMLETDDGQHKLISSGDVFFGLGQG